MVVHVIVIVTVFVIFIVIVSVVVSDSVLYYLHPTQLHTSE